ELPRAMAANLKSQPITVFERRVGDLRGQHLLAQFGSQDGIVLTVTCVLYTDDESCKITGGRPKAGGSHLRIRVPSSFDWLPISILSRGRDRFDVVGRWLFESAAPHSQRIED